MRKTTQIDLSSEEIEILLNELRVIDHWDTKYEIHRRPKWDDTVAYIYPGRGDAANFSVSSCL
jgi:hypothetical protein